MSLSRMVVLVAALGCGLPSGLRAQTVPVERLRALVADASSADAARRGAAVLELRRLRDVAAVPVVLAALRTANPPGVDALVDVLDVYDDPRKTGALIAAANPYCQPDTAERVALQLQRLGVPAAQALLDAAASHTSASSPSKTAFDEWAASTAGTIGDAAQPLLLTAFKDKRPSRRWAAVLALRQYAADTGCIQGDPCETRRVLEQATRDADPMVAQAAREAVEALDESPQGHEEQENDYDTEVSEADRRTLRSPDPLARLAAINRLVSGAVMAGRPIMLPLLKDSDERVRVAVAHAIGVLDGERDDRPANQTDPQVAQDVHALAAAYPGTSAAMRLAVARALGAAGRRLPGERRAPATTSLLALLRDDNEDVRAAAIEALGRVADPAGTRALSAILEKSRSPAERAAAAVALGRIARPESGAPIARALGDSSAEVRRNAAAALRTIYAPPATAPSVIVDAMIAALDDDAVRDVLVDALADAKDPTAVVPLVRVFDKVDTNTTCNVSFALVQIGSRRAVEPLLPLLASRNPHQRVCVVRALEGLKDPQAVGGLVAALKDENTDVRIATASALGAIGDRAAVQPLINALADESAAVRGAAAIGLGRLGDPAAVEPIIKVLPVTARDAAKALAMLKDPRAVGPLLTMLKGTNPDRLFVAEALGALKDGRAVSGLAVVLQGPIRSSDDASVIVVAVSALGNIGGPQAIAVLEKRLATADRGDPTWAGIRGNIAEALRKLGRE